MGALAAAYLEYASLGLTLAALHLDLFEQPVDECVFEHRLGSAYYTRVGVIA
jgi:hypothetical protein